MFFDMRKNQTQFEKKHDCLAGAKRVRHKGMQPILTKKTGSDFSLKGLIILFVGIAS
ncbi:hypothetical protein ACFTAO_15595 [Paenibacillus rhizoplanae]